MISRNGTPPIQMNERAMPNRYIYYLYILEYNTQSWQKRLLSPDIQYDVIENMYSILFVAYRSATSQCIECDVVR